MAAVIIRIAPPEDFECPPADNGLRETCRASSVRISNLGFRIVERLENAGVDCIVREPLELCLDSVEGAKSDKESAALDGPCVIDRSVGSPLPVAEKRCEGVGEDGSGGTLDECCVAHEGHVGIPVEGRYAVRRAERKDVVVRVLRPR